MRTSFHHQSEAQHPKSSAIHKYAGRLPHLWVMSRHRVTSASCPIFPSKQTFVSTSSSSAVPTADVLRRPFSPISTTTFAAASRSAKLGLLNTNEVSGRIQSFRSKVSLVPPRRMRASLLPPL